ncbi:nucleoside-diphosphate-sugar epimerase [Pedobacter sp. CG_S7]|uniref:NAD-dependent epimerase/dehydratase family protein n=1 Tax=Pedobacter sp. CG_S7 TaxID=3143930 RepID=UPI00339A6AC5
MKILLTGASGFLGGEILKVLCFDQIITLGRSNADLKFDLNDNITELPSVDIVIHCAGKAHCVPKTTAEKQEFFDVNVKGTNNLLQALLKAPTLPQSFVFISTVAVYGKENGRLIKEDSKLEANDPYGKSKIEAERLVQTWCEKNNVICTILRLPLVAGLNPPGNLRIMINGIRKGYYFNIAGGNAKKSIVLAKDVAAIIPKAASIGGVYHLTDGYHPSFSELAALIATQLNKSEPSSLPLWVVNFLSKVGDFLGKNAPINSNKINKMLSDLTFDDNKAIRLLGWRPTPVLKGLKIK